MKSFFCSLTPELSDCCSTSSTVISLSIGKLGLGSTAQRSFGYLGEATSMNVLLETEKYPCVLHILKIGLRLPVRSLLLLL